MNLRADRAKPAFLGFAFCVACVIAMLGYIFASGTVVLSLQWLRLEQYWRFLIVLVSACFAWSRRKELFRLRPRPSYGAGIALVAAGCLAFWLWKVCIIDFFIEAGLLFLAAGCISLLLGNAWLKALLFPLGYLVLTTSFVERAMAPVAVFMQYASATLTQVLVNAGGLQVLRDGRFLRLPYTVLEVASECSGAGQLTALIAFAIPLGVMMHKSLWPRIALLALTLPFALFVNTIRIVLVTLWNYNGLKSAIHGPHEILRMPFIYPLALLFLYLCSLLFAHIERKKGNAPASAAAAAMGNRDSLTSIIPAWICCFCMLALTLAAAKFVEARPVRYAESLADFPSHLAGWDAEPGSGSPLCGMISFYMGKPEAVLCRSYHGESGAEITLFIARFDVQNTWKRMSSVQFNSFGNSEKWVEIPVAPSSVVKARLLDETFGKQPASTLSWSVVDGRTYPTVAGARKAILLNTVKKKRNNAAFVAVSAGSGDSRQVEETMTSFAAAISPYVQNYLK